MTEEFKVGVLGAGMMGAEIALSFAISGYPVVMKEVSLELAERGKARLQGVLDRAIKKGRFTAEEKEPTLARITPVDQYGMFADANFVIEAIVEDFEVKKQALGELDTVCNPACVFATQHVQHFDNAVGHLCRIGQAGQLRRCALLFACLGNEAR